MFAGASASLVASASDEESEYVRFEDTPTRPGLAASSFASKDAETPAYTKTSEVVRDLHRTLENPHGVRGAHLSGSQTNPDLKLPQQMRLHPEVGTASDLAQPGGFRRAHLEQQQTEGAVELTNRQQARRGTALVDHLHEEGFVRRFVSHVVRKLDDGTEVVYASRAYRRGARPLIIRRPSGEREPVQPDRVKFLGFRPLSVPYWVSVNFLCGAALFLYGSMTWFDMGRVLAMPTLFARLVTYPYFAGSINFLFGCYLAFVEVINANLEEDLRTGAIDLAGAVGSIHGRSRLSLNLTFGSLSPSPASSPPSPRPTTTTTTTATTTTTTTTATITSSSQAPPPQQKLSQQTHQQRTHQQLTQQHRKPLREGTATTVAPIDGEGVDCERPPHVTMAESAESSALTAAGPTTCVEFVHSLHWWRFQPHSLLWWGALVQLAGAICFEVACVAALPPLSASVDELVCVFVPSLVGSACFTFASYIYLLEVAASTETPWAPPDTLRERLGYAVAGCNLLGSVLFFVASAGYFFKAPPHDGELYEWEFLVSEWAVRFGYGLGSLLFVLGALLSFPEVISDD